MEILNRPRRLRKNETIRSLIRETKLSIEDFIYPIFVQEGTGIKEEIPSMEGIYRYSVDKVLKEIEEVESLGIKAILLFGIPENKDEFGTEGYTEDGIIQRAVREIKKVFPQMYVITDVCMCEYTSHGHCGILLENGYVDNDKTLEYLGKIALSHARAGADMVAPSDMMDGRIEYIRNCLDENGFETIPIMAYSAKYASSFYGPFRDAADSSPAFGDRKSYQMDPANTDEAIREIELDIMEGADIIMVKPALSYLDIIRRSKDNFNMPLAAYNVSGEYSMLKLAVKEGLLDETAILESLLSIKRAGADIIISYFAKDVAKMLK
ncbi:porphobilinogen synthase [Anaerosalibacter bizertensis]|uniref:Delta-aminolevulinic acid dehydratase n=1 Tax=Anaerosalibacter bizertensis TaxID=932217 RepID=A0A9Q4FLX9_9FIRM|nr:porphobilinogen synthase [Anaerosalibacter bizertensis]MBV1818661.1 porphobilinogen synthase [Bacteroidales bacterium MSK.15.36]MCB5559579.1 porphobilinogen synthase [Anaerosalibacter bizertensis]MCG4565177.1 porphobilinogen synthase [Anaerosalibacter bizertensis]MCG4582779.1 porphobilinogen synthase [Anaerosalibacter bizertensis]MCG4584864.1 porphobilinogen synthase [Anaerosalibacter bizertensis]